MFHSLYSRWKAVGVPVLGVIMSLLCAVSHGAANPEVESVPHRTSSDIYANPCKARSFMGDIALDEAETEVFGKAPPGGESILAKNLKKDIEALMTERKVIANLLKSKKDFLHHCRRENIESSKRCRTTTNDIRNIRKEWRRLILELRDLKARVEELKQKSSRQQEGTARPRRRRAVTAIKERLWDYGLVPYTIGANFTGDQKALFQLAMRHWEEHTCITFREKEPTDKNYITFTIQDCRCCSYVGKKGTGSQGISIGKNCDKFGIVVHELGHVIGYWHEHTRPDRDKFVRIMWPNIQEGQNYNFEIEKNINSLGQPYDYNSIMHYSRNTFSKQNFMDTIVPIRQPGMVVKPEIGQRVSLSRGDIQQANILYKCPLCGKTIQEPSGQFSHAPKRGHPQLCQWRISATHGEKIVLNITMLSIPETRNCRTDYIEVRDGQYVKAPFLGRFCGNNLPDTIESSGHWLWLEYRSRVGEGDGFAAQYEALCGGHITKAEGFLTSPNYPQEYLPNKGCVWRITVDSGFTVALKFQNFGIEKHDNCVYDYLEIRDGPDESSPLVDNFCGYEMPADIQSTGRDLYVKFVSDESVQKAGFHAIYTKEYDECSKTDHGCDHVCENTLGSYKCSCQFGYQLHTDGKSCQDACGAFIDQENGTITSPSYPELYPSDRNCIWQITAPADHKIHINFTHFDLEGSNQDCEFDSVKVSSHVDGRTKLHGIFCGSTFPAPVTSEGNKIQIEFNSDNTVQKTGFRAVYQTDKDECSLENGGCQHVCKNTVGSYYCECNNGFTLHDDGHGCKEGGCHYEVKTTLGVVHSPNFPEDYPSRKDCVWHFSTVSGHRIRLTFRTFEMEPQQECTYDHVAIYDGADRDATKLGKFCGASIPDPVISTGNQMFMTFFSDVSVERKGFEIEHDTVCGGDLFVSEDTQSFVSHARYGGFNYNNREDCDWRLKGQKGRVIRLEFSNFNIEDESDCGYDSVRVYDGLKKTDELIGIYCGNQVPAPIISTSDSIRVHFQSDDTIVMKGFLASYKMVTPSHTNAGQDEEQSNSS